VAVAAIDELVGAASEAAFGSVVHRGEPAEKGTSVEVSEIMSVMREVLDRSHT